MFDLILKLFKETNSVDKEEIGTKKEAIRVYNQTAISVIDFLKESEISKKTSYHTSKQK